MLLDLYFFHAEESMAGSVFAQQISGGHYLRLRAVALALRRPPLQFVVPDCRALYERPRCFRWAVYDPRLFFQNALGRSNCTREVQPDYLCDPAWSECRSSRMRSLVPNTNSRIPPTNKSMRIMVRHACANHGLSAESAAHRITTTAEARIHTR